MTPIQLLAERHLTEIFKMMVDMGAGFATLVVTSGDESHTAAAMLTRDPELSPLLLKMFDTLTDGDLTKEQRKSKVANLLKAIQHIHDQDNPICRECHQADRHKMSCSVSKSGRTEVTTEDA